MKGLDQVYPNMPQDKRDHVYDHVWAPRSGPVGRAKELDLETKIVYATEAME